MKNFNPISKLLWFIHIIIMQELKSCFAPSNYHSNKHVSFAQEPIICTSAPFLWKDEEYSDDLTSEENEEEKFQNNDEDEYQSKSTNECSHPFFFAVIFILVSLTLLFKICHFSSGVLPTEIMNNFGNTYFLRSIIDLII